ncbi:DUF3320 domain-containing protein [Methanolapillus millepedarum]|uniref:DUF3320 domain-containing protein n=1 Tax=Methanolapillus millepedarum TaxID=3028296 RepID=A0AA96ZV17_9EURY|nr:hypothetical protein MsAc7_04650 [Methanosarcinaceae archaeon Ac7]
MVDVKQELELLRQKLLDLSLNNNLLNYTPSKKRTIEIKNDNISEIYDILVVQEKSMKFRANGTETKTKKAGAASSEADVETEEEGGLLRNILKKKENETKESSGVMLETPFTPDDLENRLFYANNQAIAIFEEQGYPILYLATGFLEWTDGSKKSFKAPLILIPIQFKRVGLKRKFTIQWTGDDIFASITLKAKLLEFGLELPEFTGAEDKHAVDFYLKAVDDLISEKDGWKVTTEAYLDFYNFKKFVMYKDLDPSVWPKGQGPETHPLINQVFNPSLPEYDGGFLENDVDIKLKAEDIYHIVNADSSQIAVIEDVKAGRNLVVEGPPGTGKSQTITNLIAELLIMGKSVLFVSEKMAALQVVKKRLDTIGLGDMCLEIHSHKAQKKAVLDELERTLKRQPPMEKNISQDLVELENLKYELNEYAKALSLKVGPIGNTVYDIYGIREDVNHYFAMQKRKMKTIEFSHPERWDKNQWMQAVSILEKMTDTLPSIGSIKNSPWNGCAPGIILPPDAQKIESDIEEAVLRAQKTDNAVDTIIGKTGLIAPSSMSGVDDVLETAEIILASPKVDRTVLKNIIQPENQKVGAGLIQKAKRFNDLDKQIEDIFTSQIFEIDIESYLQKSGKLLKFMDKDLKNQKAAVLNCYIKRVDKSDSEMKSDLQKVQEVQDLNRELGNLKQKATTLFGPFWEIGQKDPTVLDVFLEWSEHFARLVKSDLVTSDVYLKIEKGIEKDDVLKSIGDIKEAYVGLPAAVLRIVNGIGGDPSVFFKPGAVTETVIDTFKTQSAAPEFGSAEYNAGDFRSNTGAATTETDLSEAAFGPGSDPAFRSTAAVVACDDSDMDLPEMPPKKQYAFAADNPSFSESVSAKSLRSRLEKWHEELPSLVLWSQFLIYRDQCHHTVAAPMMDMIDNDAVLPEDILPTFKGNYADGVLRAEFMKKRVLSTFIKEVHESKLHKFSDLDEKVILKNRDRINVEIYSQMPQIYVGASRESEAGILLNEFNKKKAHMPIRRLMSSAGGLIQKIKPCFMMSPLSIAQYLDPLTTSFDVVIFDEASQVRPEDALGALLRGRQVVVMGDSKQLPPTTFFENLLEGDDEYNEDVVYSDVESVLNICKRSFPYKTLRWHYRSRHESLIEVSNNEFYGNHLYVYPSPLHEDKNMGLQLRYQKDTIYERGKTGVNKEEARIVAQEVIRHFIHFPDKTLMVGTFNVKQQEAIQKEVEILVKNTPGFEKVFNNEKGENFTVKNIETIQGDERDVIFVSVGFGFDQNGKLSKNFGPLNRDGGERRLNVLFTRAREKCVIFSNFTAIDLDVGDEDPAGLRILKAFLAYAETKTLLSKMPEYQSDEAAFDDSVHTFLKENGYKLHQKVGCAGYKIDMAVVNENVPGHYLIGIECDGPQYFNSHVARDRDRLRREVLTGLGWTLYRVWSTDWYMNPQKSRKSLLDAIEKAKENAKNIKPAAETAPESDESAMPDTKDVTAILKFINDRESEIQKQKKSAPKENIKTEKGSEDMKTSENDEILLFEEKEEIIIEFEEEPAEKTNPKTKSKPEPKSKKSPSVSSEESEFNPEEEKEIGKELKSEEEAGRPEKPKKPETETVAMLVGTLVHGLEKSKKPETVISATDSDTVKKKTYVDADDCVIVEKVSKTKSDTKSKTKSAEIPSFVPEPDDNLDIDFFGDDDFTELSEEDDPFSDSRILADATEEIFDVAYLIQNGIPKYESCTGVDLPSTDNLLEIPRHKLEHEIVEIVTFEGPIHKEQLIAMIKKQCDVKRMTKPMRDMIIREISSAEKSNYIRVRGSYLWSAKPRKCLVRRREGDFLDIEWICDEEILQAAVYVLKTQYSIPKDQLVKQVSLALGFKTLRPAAKEKIEGIVTEAIEDNKLVTLPNGKIYLDE